MSAVAFSNVTKRFGGDVVAVNDLDLDVEDGELLVVVGPSGCGKTTTLRMLAGLEDISAGEIRIGDRVVNGLSAKERDIAMVFQSYALYPHLSVGQNLGYPLKLAKMPKSEIRERVQSVADQLQLGELLERKPRQLSGGQRQRVAMGRAMVREPRVFLMDEPLSNLDAKLRVSMRSEVAELQAELATTMFYVTHDQVEAMTMGHRVALMRDGVLQQVAPPAELYRSPANTFVAGFIGSPPMNLIEAQVTQSDDGSCAATSGSASFGAGLEEEHRGAARLAGQPLVVGFRPEHVELVPAGSDTPATVRLVEMLGSEHLVHLDVEGVSRHNAPSSESEGSAPQRILVKIHDDHAGVRTGDSVGVRVASRHLHLFDSDSGEVIRG